MPKAFDGYSQLHPDSIRLITIHPGDVLDSICVDLVSARLLPQLNKYYEALSYVWGDTNSERTILCNGIVIAVTENLFSALQRLRFSDRPRTLWVDALCINQSDNVEKALQIHKMPDIFHSANKVLVYLGKPGLGSYTDTAMDTIAAVNKPLTTGDINLVNEFVLNAPWFQRIWVVQEVARSKLAMVVFGNKAVRWDCFNAWPMRVASVETEMIPPVILPGILHFESGYQPARSSLLQLLHSTRPNMATDPRDKIIALFGLILDPGPWSSIVNYNRTVDEIYADAAKLFVTHEKSLRFLSSAHPYPSSVEISSLPSWVPDWRIDPHIISLGLGRKFDGPYDAGGSVAIADITSSGSLVAGGVLLDCVKTVGSVHEGSNQDAYRRFESTQSGYDYDLMLLAGLSVHRLEQVRDWAYFFKYGNNDKEFTHNNPRNTVASFRALVTAAAPFTLESQNNIDCRGWKCNEGLKGLEYSDRVLHPICRGRRIFETESGLLGLGPSTMYPGDRVAVLLGGPVPYVLRKRKVGYSFIGECYILGAMAGEAICHLKDDLEKRDCYLSSCSPPICDAKLEDFEIF